MKVPLRFNDHLRWLEKIAFALNQNSEGRTDNVGTVTLTASTTTTTVLDKRIGVTSGIMFSPTTANAAAEIPTMYVGTRTAGTSFVITHSNTASVDRTFYYSIEG